MSIFVASRKGLVEFAEGPRGWTQQRVSFLGDPVSAVLDDPRDGTLYAALALGHFGVKLRRSADRGQTWEEIPAPAFPASGDKDGPAVSLIWTLVAGAADQPGRIWAGTIPGGLFMSEDRGAGWRLNEALWNLPERANWFGGGYDQPGIHTVLVDPRDSNRLTVAVSCGGVWRSHDDGRSWQVAHGLLAAYMPDARAADPSIQDAHRIDACAAAPDRVWCQHHNGIFRSDDSAASFTAVAAARPSGFGFAVAAHPADPDTAWFVPAVKDECRVPVDGRLVVSRTRDGGSSFEPLSDGLPEPPAFDLVYRHALAVDAAGRRLVMGSTTGNLWVSGDAGESWSLVSGNLPPIAQVAFSA